MPKCAFKNCSNIKQYDGVTFFRFPRDPFCCAEWTAVVAQQRCQELFTPNITSVVCSEHFHPDDLVKSGDEVELRDGAVPYADLPKVSTYEERHTSSTSKAFLNDDDDEDDEDALSSFKDMGSMNPMEIGHCSKTDIFMELDSPGLSGTITFSDINRRDKAIEVHTAITTEAIDVELDSNMDEVKLNEDEPYSLYGAVVDGDDDEMEVGNADKLKVTMEVDDGNKQAASLKLMENEKVESAVIEYRKKLRERNQAIKCLYKRNETLCKRVKKLKKDLKASHKRIEWNNAIGRNLCKTLFFRYVRSHENLFSDRDNEGSDDDGHR